MGRIKSKLIKRTGKNLMDDEKFNGNFGDNKDVLGSLMPSKKIRNQVAGYITRKKKTQETSKKISWLSKMINILDTKKSKV